MFNDDLQTLDDATVISTTSPHRASRYVRRRDSQGGKLDADGPVQGAFPLTSHSFGCSRPAVNELASPLFSSPLFYLSLPGWGEYRAVAVVRRPTSPPDPAHSTGTRPRCTIVVVFIFMRIHILICIFIHIKSIRSALSRWGTAT